MADDEFNPDGERIAKTLARAGVCSRRDAEKLIAEGRVSVNGKKLDTPAFKVTPKDEIRVDGKRVAAPQPTRLWRYHKPDGLLTTNHDPKGRATIYDRLPPDMPRVVSIGRLDLNSEGLLLLTNDGELARQFELPANAWSRHYRARAFGRISQEELDTLVDGIVVDRVRYGSITATLERQQGGNAWISLILTEGKNREVRRVLEALGLKVNRLIRTSYGPFELGLLKPGQVEEVPPRQVKDMFGSSKARRRGGAGG
ncbi:MAG: rRNA pseudouridine synthase [Hyphomonadaceae bacterium]|nr:rRNA pseudouridine synthase [Hyphomonadaceae bacterium]